MRERVVGTSGEDTNRVEGIRNSGSGKPGPDIVGAEMIQITPQMKILLATDAVDGRKGIDSLAPLCVEKLETDPFVHCRRVSSQVHILPNAGVSIHECQDALPPQFS